MRFCPLFSGSSGNCIFIEGGGVRVLVDAGLAGRTIINALAGINVSPDTIDAIVVTHEHSDHIKGVGVISRRYSIPVYANSATWDAMSPLIGEVAPSCVRIFETDRDFFIHELNVLPFATPHDAAESVGYCFNHKGAQVSTLTDVGHINARLLSAVQESDIILLESNHDVEMLKAGSYPYTLKRRILGDNGHLSNDAAGEALVKLYKCGLRNAVLGHLSHENNLEPLALETVRQALRNEDIFDEEFSLCVAHRDRAAGMFEIE